MKLTGEQIAAIECIRGLFEQIEKGYYCDDCGKYHTAFRRGQYVYPGKFCPDCKADRIREQTRLRVQRHRGKS